MSKLIWNNQEKFVDLWAKTYKFVTAKRDIIRSEQVETIILSLENGSQLILANIAYTLNCNSNLIFFSQFWETGISYHAYLKYILLKQEMNIIGSITKKKNHFILNIELVFGKVILAKGRGRPTYLFSKNS